MRERYEILRRRVHTVGLTASEWTEFETLLDLLGIPTPFPTKETRCRS